MVSIRSYRSHLEDEEAAGGRGEWRTAWQGWQVERVARCSQAQESERNGVKGDRTNRRPNEKERGKAVDPDEGRPKLGPEVKDGRREPKVEGKEAGFYARGRKAATGG